MLLFAQRREAAEQRAARGRGADDWREAAEQRTGPTPPGLATLILSKAFQLAEDTKIADRTIREQIDP